MISAGSAALAGSAAVFLELPSCLEELAGSRNSSSSCRSQTKSASEESSNAPGQF